MARAHARPKVSDSAKNTRNILITQIQKSVESGDLLSALGYWRSLEEHKASVQPDDEGYGLPESTEQKLASLFKSQVQKAHAAPSWDPVIAQDFALRAAIHGSAEALYGLMLVQLQMKRPQETLGLYRQFMASVDSPEIVDDVDDNGLAGLVREGNESNFDHFRVSVLLAAITAHAMTDSFRAAFDTYMSSKLRVSSFRKNLFFQEVNIPSEVVKKAQKYANRLEILALLSKPSALSKHIMNLAHPRTAPVLIRLYQTILDGIHDESDPYLAADRVGLSETRLAAMTEVGWTSFQTGFIRCERKDLAAQLWSDLANLGIQPGVTMWTGLLDVYADLRDSTQSMLTWNMMLRQKIEPDELSYRAMIAVLFDDNKLDEAIQRFQEFRKRFKIHNAPQLTVYNTVLRGLLRSKRILEANQLLSTMLKNGPAPDVVSFNTFLGFYSREKDFSGLATTVNRMSDAKITGDVVTFSTIMTALLQVGERNAPNIILGIMQKQGVQPNVATYTAIIDHLMREQSNENLEASLKLLDKMEQDPVTKPNEVTYTTILTGLYRGRWTDRQRAEEVRGDIVSRMRRFKVAFRLPTYHTLIQAALDSPYPDGYKDALALIQEMEDQGIPRVNNTWYILFKGLERLEQWEAVNEMVRKMWRSQHKPTESLQKVIDRIVRKTS
ncbi:Pentatricopeptide repeat-containing protein, chloroplastic [Psilocybe cubensis]|nr:Pentatricopeptide repeat-containing protein, chloroplastic [Psilocybe cubensis]KAH9486633.1 Pentatricopeptide repeat-containing protein, chloroplastic [Psilocybe cubensis]